MLLSFTASDVSCGKGSRKAASTARWAGAKAARLAAAQAQQQREGTAFTLAATCVSVLSPSRDLRLRLARLSFSSEVKASRPCGGVK